MNRHEHDPRDDPTRLVRDFFRLEPYALDRSHEVFRALQAQAPAVHLREPDLYVVTGYDALKEVTSRTEDFSSRDVTGLRDAKGVVPRALLTADPPEHSRHKRLAGRPFSPGALRRHQDAVRTVANDLIDAFIGDGRVEFVSQFALRFPVVAIAALLGVPISDRQKFVDWAFAHIEPLGNPRMTAEQQTRYEELMGSFAVYFRDVIAERRVSPGDDFITTMVGKSDEGDTPLTNHEMILILRQLLTGGIETTAKLLTSTWELLLRNPEQLELVRADHALVPGALEETLRLKGPVHGMFRNAIRDADLLGCKVPRDAILFLAYSSAGRDPSLFEDPDVFDVRRPNANRHMAFGYGVHRCIGVHLARMQARIAFEQLLVRLGDVRFAPENRFAPFPSFVIQGLRELHLTFEPGKETPNE